ncbi:MAG: SRPBCC family protein [bacterium]|nr:SRPBCC family protein [Candidatus Kapabacteria bacterium]
MNTIRIQAAALIDAPAKRVYDIIADYRDAHPRILPRNFFTEMEIERGGVGAGTVFRIGTKLFGQKRTASMVVTEPDPGCVISERDPISGLVTTFRVSAEHHGHHAHVTIVTDIPKGRGLRGVIEALVLPRVLRKVYNQELQQLSDVARGTGIN